MKSNARSQIFIITGQTATGKTAAALSLAKKYNGELVNADSRQIYQGLSIVPGKDIPVNNFTVAAQTDDGHTIGFVQYKNTAIWLLDILTPDKPYSAAAFEKDALIAIQSIFTRGKIPIIVGGSYFYLQALIYEIPTQGIAPDWALRQKANLYSIPALQNLVSQNAPELYEKLNESDRQNPQRLLRKWELIRSGVNIKPLNYDIKIGKKLGKNNTFSVNLTGYRILSKDRLQERITKRVEARMREGALAETQNALSHYSPQSPGLQSIGYRQLKKYLDGVYTIDQACDQWILREMQYAKRQYTFMKKDPHIHWVDA